MQNVVDIAASRKADLGLVSVLVSISKQTRSSMAIRLAEIGLKTGEDEIVCAMEDGTSKSVSHLAAVLNVGFSTIVKCLDDLEQRGLVQRIAGPLVRLSDTGIALSAKVAGTRLLVARDIRKSVGNERFAEIASALEDLHAALASSMTPLR